MHLRSYLDDKRGVCGYKHKGAGFGMTVEKPENVTCPRCLAILDKIYQ